MKRQIVCLVWMCCIVLVASAQSKNRLYMEYIETYKGLAMEEMQKHRIPASITLAQGLLESAAGKSTLARYSNNHFGIKCGRTWTGEKTYHNDDRPNECFREYDHASQSYEDHSLFLVKNQRYASLFNLNIQDYKGWAHGLKKAGYATNPQYGKLLISLIERYELYRYDVLTEGKTKHEVIAVKEVKVRTVVAPASRAHQPYIANGLVYIVVRSGDNWKSISKEVGISEKKLCSYNDLYKGYALKAGDILYLKQKNKKAPKDKRVHVLHEGESLHSVSQIYGIRLKNLYKMNGLSMDASTPPVGHIIRLR